MGLRVEVAVSRKYVMGTPELTEDCVFLTECATSHLPVLPSDTTKRTGCRIVFRRAALSRRRVSSV